MDKMDKRIVTEIGKGKACDLTELQLVKCSGDNGQVVGLSDEFKSLAELDMHYNELTSLKQLPPLPALTRLDVAHNQIVDGFESLQASPLLRDLCLTNNKIASLAALDALKELKKLTTLDLAHNPLAQDDTYKREDVFAMLPQIKYLDGLSRDGEEEPDAEDMGDTFASIESDDEPDSDSDDDDDDGEDDGDRVNGCGTDELSRDGLIEDDDEDVEFQPDAEPDKKEEEVAAQPEPEKVVEKVVVAEPVQNGDADKNGGVAKAEENGKASGKGEKRKHEEVDVASAEST